MRAALDVADIFRRHGPDWRARNTGHVSLGQFKVMSAIETCRTAALGGHLEGCQDCGHRRIAYNSCRNRHCPKCQGAAAREWLAARQADLLPVGYFHVVFTLPAEIADIAFHNKATVYDLLFKAASETITTIAADPQHLGARIGIFVAEKRAALEVVQRRLAQVGLADFCLDLFSSKANKTAVLGQLERAQSATEVEDRDGWTELNSDLALLREELNGYVRELHRVGRNGWTPFRAIGAVLKADDGAVPRVALSWPNEDAHDAGDWRRLVEVTEEAREMMRRAGDAIRMPELAGISNPEWSPVWQTRLLEAARKASTDMTALEAATQAAASTLKLEPYARSRPALTSLATLASLLLDPLASEAAWSLSESATDLREAALTAATQAERHRRLRQALGGAWKDGAFALPLATLRSEWRAAGEKWMLARSVGQRSVRKRLATEVEGAVPEDCGPDLDRLLEMQQIAAAVVATPNTVAFGRAWKGLETDFARLQAAYDWGQGVKRATASCADDPATLAGLRSLVRQLVGEASDLLAPSASLGSTLFGFKQALDAVVVALDALAGLSGTPVERLVPEAHQDWLPSLSRRLEGWPEASRYIQEWCAWRGISQSAGKLGLGPLLQAMEDGAVGADDAVRVLEGNYARWWIDLAIGASPKLRSFVAARHEKRLERFRALDARTLELSSRLARARIASRIPGMAMRQVDPEFTVLTRELAKRQRHLPVRQLASRMPKALRRLTPCLMMSPLSVAQYLPADAEPFDLVIFDEASQITTWDAIGALGRGRQVVVVGDPRQLPPTSFFERRSGEGDGEAVEVETHDLDSVLDECLGAGIPTVELTWHYRSRHESLIAFSNQTYYGGRLVTFPSPVTRDDAVSFRHVTDGVYARGAGRTNEREAQVVVAEALAVLRAPEARSLGIVTFNAEQQTLIENLLDEARRADPSLERHFGDDAAEPVLIKNLEGIQGEERDVMLFSLTYGPDATGRIALNFGPINLPGGERRLNVAVTRARERLVVFGSLKADQLDLSRTGATGVRHLKRFLSFAEHGARSFVTATDGSVGDHESPFETEVAERLHRLGWTTHPQVGVSGFRIDLGVVDPDAPGGYLAGVECDGATYHRGATARDRDRLRQHVLQTLGWRILRIWSTDWWTNAAREADRIHEQLSKALEDARAERATKTEASAPIDLEPDPGAAGMPSHASADGTMEAASPVSQNADPELFHDPSYRDCLSGIVAGVLREQGPIREDKLVQVVARMHGFARAGREIKERVMAVVPDASAVTTEDVGRFVWPPDIAPEDWKIFRAPAAGQTADPTEMPMAELVALAKRYAAPGLPEDAVVTAMRNACGLQRIAASTRQRYLVALSIANADRVPPRGVEAALLSRDELPIRLPMLAS